MSQVRTGVTFYAVLAVELLEFGGYGSLPILQECTDFLPGVIYGGCTQTRVVTRNIQGGQHAEELLVGFQQDVARTLCPCRSRPGKQDEKAGDKHPPPGGHKPCHPPAVGGRMARNAVSVRSETQGQDWSQEQTDYPRTVIRRRDRTTSPSVGFPEIVAGWKRLK